MESDERYARQTILPEVGEAGQRRLARASVLVVGAGALGTPALYYLAAAGVGTLGIADDDTLELSNLHRQILYGTADIGRPKAQTAAHRLAEFNPETIIDIHPVRVTADNAETLFRHYDLVIDATDRLETKFLINDACARAERVLVHAAILGFEAQVAVFDARSGPCLRCLFPEPPTVPALTCSEAGVLGAVPGMAGSLQALEAIKCILTGEFTASSPSPSTGEGWDEGEQTGPPLRGDTPRPAPLPQGEREYRMRTLLGRLWLMDGATLQSRVVELPRDPACPVCRHDPADIRLAESPAAVRHIEPDELEGHPGALLVDVREDEEWAQGHLEGAIHRPLSRLAENIPELPERDGYIAYCAHGIRSETAARLLADAGYKNVFSLKGGIAAVRGAAKPERTPE